MLSEPSSLIVEAVPRKDRPLVSVITPVLNRATAIRSCLMSVEKQTYSPIEHIVVDGGSSDGTVDTIKSFESRHRLRWISEPDEGMYDAINKGLNMAEGEVVCYLNSDDLYVPWSVEVAVGGLSAGSDLIYGDLGVLLREREVSGFFIQFYPDFDLAYYTHVAAIGQPTVFLRRSLLEKIGGFDDSYKLIGDCEYWLRAAVSGATIRHVKEVLAIQIEHGATLRMTQTDRLKEEFARLRREYAKHAEAPRSPRYQRLKKSVVWRMRQLQFRRAFRAPQPDRWPAFVRLLRAKEVPFDDVGALLALLPERFRPARSTWGDLRVFERKLMEGIGVGSGTT